LVYGDSSGDRVLRCKRNYVNGRQVQIIGLSDDWFELVALDKLLVLRRMLLDSFDIALMKCYLWCESAGPLDRSV
jgi:hypothetical protein